jgi:hypothetical protein
MGSTECFRANAAFSLYGILQGKEDRGCGRRTFINSFFTNYGVETFTQSLSDVGVPFQSSDDAGNEYPGGVTSQCSYEATNNNADDSTAHNAKNGASYTSKGLGCYKNFFAMKLFKGQFCDTREEIRVSDKLASFNSDIQQATCVPIYAPDEGESNALDILLYSSACSIREFPNVCPDPYGKLAAYSRSDAKTLATAASPTREKVKDALSWILLIAGSLLLVFSVNVALRRARRSRRKSVLEQGSRRHWFTRPKSASSEASNARTVDTSTESGRRPFQNRRLFRCFSPR